MHKKGELELLRETLGSEIQSLQTVSVCVMQMSLLQVYFRQDTVISIQD